MSLESNSGAASTGTLSGKSLLEEYEIFQLVGPE